MSSDKSATAQRPSPATRLYYLDWLRVLSILVIFFYHNNRFYDYGDWHIKNPQPSLTSNIVENALGIWIMPFLFALSGAALFYSLKSRSAGGFARERFMRLALPLLTLGMFVFGPFQIYLERISHGAFSGSFWQFLPRYFDGMYGFGGNFAWMGVHLWYLMLLLVFSMLFLPLFLPSRKNGKSPLSRLSFITDRPWGLFLLFIALGVAVKLADALGLGITRGMGGWDILSYMLFFIYGYLLFANPRTIGTLSKHCLVLAVLGAGLGALWLTLRYAVMPHPDAGFFFKDEMRSLASWLGILASFGLGARHLTANGRHLAYANEAVLPFYILHQPIVLAIGYFVVQWDLPIIAKYFLIAATSFAAIMIVYEFLVRRAGFLRFLFGMKRSPSLAPLPRMAGLMLLALCLAALSLLF